LNNDIELDPGCIGELVRALDEHPGAGSACAKLIDYHDRSRLDGTGDAFFWTGEAHRRGQGDPDEGQYDEPQEVFGACGGAALYRRTALERVGLFDERLYAIKEDVDWAFRAQLAGFSCRYVPSAVAYHMGGATIGRELGDFALYLNWRNNIWVIAKNYPGSALVRHGHQLVWGQAKNLSFALHARRIRIWLRVVRDALRGMPATLRDRRSVQRNRVVGTRELERRVGVRP
jgi:GT2 family glycosyltransferase